MCVRVCVCEGRTHQSVSNCVHYFKCTAEAVIGPELKLVHTLFKNRYRIILQMSIAQLSADFLNTWAAYGSFVTTVYSQPKRQKAYISKCFSIYVMKLFY